MAIREFASGLKFPEGPVALDDGSVLVGEIPLGRITRVKKDGTLQTIAEPGGGTNGLAIGPDGALFVCNNGGAFEFFERDGRLIPGPTPSTHKGGRIERIDIATGKVERLYDSCDGKRLHAPNDLQFDNHGGFYFSDNGADSSDGEFRWHGGVYYAKADGSSVKRVVPRVPSANGVGISPDGKTLYYADTNSCRLYSMPISAPGVIDLPPGFRRGNFVGTYQGQEACLFDSLGIQADGGVSVATLLIGGISTFGPDGQYRFDKMPDDGMCTNICWGGKDMKTAYITLSGSGRLVAADWHTQGLRLPHNA